MADGNKANSRYENAVDVDGIWKELNTWGWYQKKQTLVTLCSIWSFGLHMFSIVFIGRNVWISKRVKNILSLIPLCNM